MLTAQSGIFALGTGSHAYLEFTLQPDVAPLHLATAIDALPAPRMTTGGLNLVVGFRPSLWSRIAPQQAPQGVHDFTDAVQGVDGYAMPATQHDLWVWIAGHSYDKVFDASRAAITALAPFATLADETAGWTYKENRDLTGFIDGTENPSLLEAPEVALIPEGQAGAGSSVVLVQKWTHDIAAWEALSVPEQERVMGRTKADSVELAEEVRGPQSHVSRNVIEEGGVEQPIFRRNAPFGTASTHGTMFVGFSADQHRLERMLQRMAGAEDGVRDALTRYATAITGAYYVVPPVEVLRVFAAPDA
jgi:putative iron-dependent peroxidase